MLINHAPRTLEVVLFDMFGTCVDWRGSLIRECAAIGQRRGFDLDWSALADGWRAGYAPAMDRIRAGLLPWMNLDALNCVVLNEWLTARGVALDQASRGELNRCWERLTPWPDVVPGLRGIKAGHLIAPLSNGSLATLTGIAKFGGLPWDCILSSEMDRVYKWDREAYLMAARLLRRAPDQVLMVAAHRGDLKAAREVGFRTCFVARPDEYGDHPNPDLDGPDEFDMHVQSFWELAEALEKRNLP